MTLTEARTSVGWTQTQLAKAVGAGVSTISELEKSAAPNPGYQLVMRIVNVLRQQGLELVPEDIFPVQVDDRESDQQERRSGADRRQGVAS